LLVERRGERLLVGAFLRQPLHCLLDALLRRLELPPQALDLHELGGTA
jgi:hypothetical protein